MQVTHIITTVEFEKLKQKAKRLKKEKGILHHEALDMVASEFGAMASKRHQKYGNVPQTIFLWKHIAEAHKQTKMAEDAINDGFVVLIDPKNDPHCDTEYFAHDMQLECLCEDMIKELYLQRTEPEFDGDEEIIPTEESLLEWFEDEFSKFQYSQYSFGFFRLKKDIPDSKDEAIEIYFKEFFFAPEFIVFKGKAFDMSVGD